jgi:phosphatidylglycerophosphatase A
MIWKYGFEIFTLYFKVLFMNSQDPSLETLQDIKKMMNQSSRFISLSGLSGVSAGITALVGAWFANDAIQKASSTSQGNIAEIKPYDEVAGADLLDNFLGSSLFLIAALTLIIAIILAVGFTYFRSTKQGIPVWGNAARRLVWNLALPLFFGGIFLLKLIEAGVYGLIAPGCLIFYGLALVNASKYTLGDIRFLGYAMLILGLINCWLPGYGLYFWATGFGILHIVYGMIMWNKYERN